MVHDCMDTPVGRRHRVSGEMGDRGMPLPHQARMCMQARTASSSDDDGDEAPVLRPYVDIVLSAMFSGGSEGNGDGSTGAGFGWGGGEGIPSVMQRAMKALIPSGIPPLSVCDKSPITAQRIRRAP